MRILYSVYKSYFSLGNYACFKTVKVKSRPTKNTYYTLNRKHNLHSAEESRDQEALRSGTDGENSWGGAQFCTTWSELMFPQARWPGRSSSTAIGVQVVESRGAFFHDDKDKSLGELESEKPKDVR